VTAAGRIRELMLDNLFAVFNLRDPERRMEAIERNCSVLCNYGFAR
jgi:hypothetical protein